MTESAIKRKLQNLMGHRVQHQTYDRQPDNTNYNYMNTIQSINQSSGLPVSEKAATTSVISTV